MSVRNQTEVQRLTKEQVTSESTNKFVFKYSLILNKPKPYILSLNFFSYTYTTQTHTYWFNLIINALGSVINPFSPLLLTASEDVKTVLSYRPSVSIHALF